MKARFAEGDLLVQLHRRQQELSNMERIWQESAARPVSPDSLSRDQIETLIGVMERTKLILAQNNWSAFYLSDLHADPIYDPLDILKVALDKAYSIAAPQEASLSLDIVFGLAWWILEHKSISEQDMDSGLAMSMRVRMAMTAVLFQEKARLS